LVFLKPHRWLAKLVEELESPQRIR